MASTETKLHEPSPRFAHLATAVGGKCYLWGGRVPNFSESGKLKLASTVEIFNHYSATWESHSTAGVPPPGLYYGACASLLDSFYWFGGQDGNCYSDSLHTIDPSTLEWRELQPLNKAAGPMRKYGCGMVAHHHHQLALFGGFGIPDPIGLTDPKAIFTKDTNYTDGRGWSNEFHMFNIRKGKWSSPPTTGPKPPPCDGFSFTAINDHQAVFFGGFQPTYGIAVSDCYLMDFDSMEWTKLERPEGESWPAGRQGHAACCLNYGDKYPQLLVSGGVDNNDKTLSDLWILDIKSAEWRELTLSEDAQLRALHSTTAISLESGWTLVIMFGGMPMYDRGKLHEDQSKLTKPIVLEFVSKSVTNHFGSDPLTRQWVLIGKADCFQLRSVERVLELAKLRKANQADLNKEDVKDQVGTVDQSLLVGNTTQQQAGLNMGGVEHQLIQTEIVEMVDQHVQAGSTPQQRGYLRGVEVIDYTSFTYRGRAKSYDWRGFGFRMHIPECAVAPNVDECYVYVTASLSGQFQFPDNTNLISGIYWIASSERFLKQITIEIQHCAANSESLHTSKFTHIIAKCTQENLPYRFRFLNGGVFTPGSRYGSIELTHFSGIGIVEQTPPQMPMTHLAVSYCARLYYSSSDTQSWDIFFAIMRDLELHIAAIDAKYAKARVGPDQEVMFEEEQITLDIPKEGLELESGWTILPQIFPRITKQQVDNFSPGRRVPSCQLSVVWTGKQEQPVQLAHRVELLGAKEPFDFFLIRLPSLPASSPAPFQGGKNDRIPSKPQLKDLMDALYNKVADKWKIIGIKLEIPKGKLASIAEKYRSDPHNCLVEMLETWLEQVNPSATWATIIEAIEFLGEKELGEEMRRKHLIKK